VTRLAIVGRLRDGAHEQAARLLAGGPPGDEACMGNGAYEGVVVCYRLGDPPGPGFLQPSGDSTPTPSGSEPTGDETPAPTNGGEDDGGGSSAAIFIIIGVIAAVVVVGGGFFMMRRGGGSA